MKTNFNCAPGACQARDGFETWAGKCAALEAKIQEVAPESIKEGEAFCAGLSANTRVNPPITNICTGWATPPEVEFAPLSEAYPPIDRA